MCCRRKRSFSTTGWPHSRRGGPEHGFLQGIGTERKGGGAILYRAGFDADFDRGGIVSYRLTPTTFHFSYFEFRSRKELNSSSTTFAARRVACRRYVFCPRCSTNPTWLTRVGL